MDAADQYLREAEKCERLAKTCLTEICRAFFMDAAAHWRQRAVEALNKVRDPECERDKVSRKTLASFSPVPARPPPR